MRQFESITIQAMREIHQLIPHSLMWENPYAGHGLIMEKSECAQKLAVMFFSGDSSPEIETLANSEACQSVPSTTFDDTKRFLKKMTLPEEEFPAF